MTLIDTHCHLYGEEFKDDLEAVIARAEAVGIGKIYLPGIDAAVIPDLLRLESSYPAKCIGMMGLHPCYVKQNYRDELSIVADWFSKRRFAAVGEIGLDYYWDTSFKQEQIEAFKFQMQLAVDYKLPIVIHTRNAMDETIELVNGFREQGIRGIFHCFGGSLAQAQAIMGAGFYLGIGGVLTYKKSGLAELLAEIPLQHLVLETDAPYLPPVPYRGKRNEPAYLIEIAQRLAEVKRCSVEEVASITTANAQKIFES